jgi:hypothetical protein
MPEEEFSKDKRPISIITLEDIEVEYSLVLSRLRLSSHIQELHEHGQFSNSAARNQADDNRDHSLT